MSAYMIRFDGQNRVVDAPGYADAITVWREAMQIEWGDDYDGTEQPESVADLTGLVRQMDRNRETLGDACRVCGERLWTGPGGARTPNHAGGCAVAAALAAKVPHA